MYILNIRSITNHFLVKQSLSQHHNSWPTLLHSCNSRLRKVFILKMIRHSGFCNLWRPIDNRIQALLQGIHNFHQRWNHTKAGQNSTRLTLIDGSIWCIGSHLSPTCARGITSTLQLIFGLTQKLLSDYFFIKQRCMLDSRESGIAN